MDGHNCFLAGLLVGLLVAIAFQRVPSVLVGWWERWEKQGEYR